MNLDLFSHKKRERLRLLVGFCIGAIFPVLGALLVIWVRWGYFYRFDIYKNILFEPKMLAFVITLGLFANLPAFHFFTWKKRHNSVKGVVIATCFWGLFLVLYTI